MKAFKRLLLSKVRLEVQALEFHVTINQDCIATEIKQRNRTFGLFFLQLAHFHLGKGLTSYERLSKQFKNYCTSRVAKKEPLTAINMFKLSYFNRNLQIALRDAESRK